VSSTDLARSASAPGRPRSRRPRCAASGRAVPVRHRRALGCPFDLSLPTLEGMYSPEPKPTIVVRWSAAGRRRYTWVATRSAITFLATALELMS
jgi:hypothetical protein